MFITILRMILLYLMIISGAIFYADIFNKKVNKTIILSFLTIAMLMYVFALFDIMQIGVYIVGFLSLISGTYSIVNKLIKKQCKNFLKYNVLTSGTLFFTILYIGIMILCYNKVMIDWDNYSYWSYYSKYYFFNNTIGRFGGNNYPPFPTILQYFVMKIIGEYRQGYEAFTLQLLEFSFFLPLFEKNKTILGKIIVGISIIILPATFISILFYDSSYADAFLGLATGYAFYTYLTEKNKKFLCFELMLLLSIITLTKSIGIGFAAIIVLCLLIYEFILKIKYKQIRRCLKSKEFITIYMLILIIVLTFLSINIFNKLNYDSNAYNINKDLKNQTSSIEYIINSVKSIFTKQGTEMEMTGGKSIVLMITDVMMATAIYSKVRIKVVVALILFIIFGILMYIFYWKKKKGYITMLICINLGFVLYIGMLQVAYLLYFTKSQMLLHNGADRYVQTFLMTILFFIFAMTIEFINAKHIKTDVNQKTRKIVKLIFKDVCYLTILVLIFITIPKIYIKKSTINSFEWNKEKLKKIENIKPITDTITESNIEKDAKILLLSYEPDDALYFYMTRYYLFPMKINIGGSIKNQSSESIKKYDYVFIYKIEDDFDNTNTDFINSNMELSENRVYRVNNLGRLENI